MDKPACIIFNNNGKDDPDRPKISVFVEDYFYGTHTPMKYKSKPCSSQKDYKCPDRVCGYKELKNNIRFMGHIRHKVEREWKEDAGRFDFSICNHCHMTYDSPFHLQVHIENVHAAVPAPTTCRICEVYFKTQGEFLSHMKDTHSRYDMPYICGVCKYRSSFYSQLMEHFRNVHKDESSMICPYCLMVYRTKDGYLKHVRRHVKMSLRCNSCRLVFFESAEKTKHMINDHETVYPISPKPTSNSKFYQITPKNLPNYTIYVTIKENALNSAKVIQRSIQRTVNASRNAPTSQNSIKADKKAVNNKPKPPLKHATSPKLATPTSSVNMNSNGFVNGLPGGSVFKTAINGQHLTRIPVPQPLQHVIQIPVSNNGGTSMQSVALIQPPPPLIPIRNPNNAQYVQLPLQVNPAHTIVGNNGTSLVLPPNLLVSPLGLSKPMLQPGVTRLAPPDPSKEVKEAPSTLFNTAPLPSNSSPEIRTESDDNAAKQAGLNVKREAHGNEPAFDAPEPFPTPMSIDTPPPTSHTIDMKTHVFTGVADSAQNSEHDSTVTSSDILNNLITTAARKNDDNDVGPSVKPESNIGSCQFTEPVARCSHNMSSKRNLHKCMECKQDIKSIVDHFKSQYACMLCSFVTHCGEAFLNHADMRHASQSSLLSDDAPEVTTDGDTSQVDNLTKLLPSDDIPINNLMPPLLDTSFDIDNNTGDGPTKKRRKQDNPAKKSTGDAECSEISTTENAVEKVDEKVDSNDTSVHKVTAVTDSSSSEQLPSEERDTNGKLVINPTLFKKNTGKAGMPSMVHQYFFSEKHPLSQAPTVTTPRNGQDSVSGTNDLGSSLAPPKVDQLIDIYASLSTVNHQISSVKNHISDATLKNNESTRLKSPPAQPPPLIQASTNIVQAPFSNVIRAPFSINACRGNPLMPHTSPTFAYNVAPFTALNSVTINSAPRTSVIQPNFTKSPTIGYGNASKPVSPAKNGTKYKVLKPPSGLTFQEISATSFMVKWSAPVDSCEITNYKLMFQGSGLPTTQTLPPTQNVCRLVGLKSDTLYQINLCSCFKNIKSTSVTGTQKTLKKDEHKLKMSHVSKWLENVKDVIDLVDD